MAVVEAISKAEAAAEAAGSRPKFEPPHTSTTDTIFDKRQRDDENLRHHQTIATTNPRQLERTGRSERKAKVEVPLAAPCFLDDFFALSKRTPPLPLMGPISLI